MQEAVVSLPAKVAVAATECVQYESFIRSQTSFFVFSLLCMFMMGLILGNRLWRKYQFAVDDIRKEAYENSFAEYSEDARMHYAVTVMSVMHEIGGRAAAIPQSSAAFENIFRESEYRYRHWVGKMVVKGPWVRKVQEETKPPPGAN